MIEISVYVCKNVNLLWYLSYKFCLIVLCGDETLPLCIIILSLDVEDFAPETNVQSCLVTEMDGGSGPHGNMGIL